VRRLSVLLTVLAVLGFVVACGSKLPGAWVVQLGPRISGVTAPTAANHDGDTFVFGVTVSGPAVVAWSWNFGGGADPNTSTAGSPSVTLVNPSTTEDVTYHGTVTVTDADGRSDTFEFDFVVGRRLNSAPVFVTVPAAITGNFSFSINDEDGDPVAITLAVTSGTGVTIAPTSIAATSANYGPFDVTVTSGNVENTDIVITITLNDGVNADVVTTVGGTIPGITLPQNSIVIVPSATTVNAGDTFLVTVYGGNLDFALGYLNTVDIAYSANVAPDTASWNLGAAGNAFDFKDGFWASVTDALLPPPTSLFFMTPGHVQVNVSLLGSPPTGAAAGTSGALFNVMFTANTAGAGTFDFVATGTNYFDPSGATHDFTNLVNATVTVN